MEALLKLKPAVNAQDVKKQTPLHVAAGKDVGKIISALLGASATVDIADMEKQAPLHISAKNGRLEAVNVLVEELLNKEKTLDATDNTGRHSVTPSFVSIKKLQST